MKSHVQIKKIGSLSGTYIINIGLSYGHFGITRKTIFIKLNFEREAKIAAKMPDAQFYGKFTF